MTSSPSSRLEEREHSPAGVGRCQGDGDGYLAFLLSCPATVAGWLLLRRPGGASWCWFSAGVTAAIVGGGAARLAGQLGWGHPLLFTLIAACGYTVCAACITVAGAIVIRSARRDRRDLTSG